MNNMKKFLLVSAALSTAIILGGCTEEEKAEKKPETEVKTEVEEKETAAHDHGEHSGEPDEHTTCAFCNMKVYTKDHELGKFTAKMVNEKGETLFFDDIGCLLNYERDTKEKGKERYVRDFDSLDWVKLEEAEVVKTDMKTPMNYGYAFFKDEAGEKKFIESHSHSHEAEVSEIDEIALERYMKKKQMQEQGKEMKHEDQMKEDGEGMHHGDQMKEEDMEQEEGHMQ